jgi:Co/Zn/Cd efflux system component
MRPSNFESLLSATEAKKYMRNRFPFGWLRTEVFGSGDQYTRQLGNDMAHFAEVRALVRKSLSDRESDQPGAASTWASFLKPRVEAIEFWLTFLTALGAVASATFALLALHAQSQNEPPLFYGGIAGVLALIVVTYNFELNRRKSWYKYLIAHLDAIK